MGFSRHLRVRLRNDHRDDAIFPMGIPCMEFGSHALLAHRGLCRFPRLLFPAVVKWTAAHLLPCGYVEPEEDRSGTASRLNLLFIIFINNYLYLQ